ncbi:MAG: hypothetical protein J1F14_05750 [Treponema sp.]|nr:hypothetical protein [Treponema sp.]
MRLSKQTYRTMNKAYNTLFDEWQNIDEMPPELFKRMNMALVILDGVLDELKQNASDDVPAQNQPGTSAQDDDIPKFTVFGGKK